jgi:hypothetical protein
VAYDGHQARPFTPIAALSLDEPVPADHFYRHLDRVLDLSFVCGLVQDRYAAGVGRPSVDPRVFFLLLPSCEVRRMASWRRKMALFNTLQVSSRRDPARIVISHGDCARWHAAGHLAC